MITALILIPLFGAFAVCVWPHTNARPIALIFNAITATLVFMLWRNFDANATGLQMVERHVWIPAIGAEYLVGIDGLSLLLVLLTSIIIPFAFLELRPEGTKRTLRDVSDWLTRHARQVIASVALGVGAYMAISGAVRLLS